MKLQRTPQREFWPYILRALVRHGGTAHVEEIYSFIDVHMKTIFNTYDLSDLYGAVPEPRWKNQTRTAAKCMRRVGLIEDSVQRNIWRISQKGKEFLDGMRK